MYALSSNTFLFPVFYNDSTWQTDKRILTTDTRAAVVLLLLLMSSGRAVSINIPALFLFASAFGRFVSIVSFIRQVNVSSRVYV